MISKQKEIGIGCMAKISVIIPCYNVEQYIDDCMDSLINQTIGFEHLEIILVDDKSTDSTPLKLAEYEKKYPDNVMLILCEENGKQGTARNIGLTYATGEYISFVDSDDWIRRDTYEILLTIMNNTDVDLIQFRHADRFTKEGYMDEPLGEFTYDLFEYGANRKSLLLNSSVLNESCWRKFYKKALIDKAGVRFAEKVSYEEPMFTYPLKFFVDKIVVVEIPFYNYRQNEFGTMHAYMQDPTKIVEHLYVQKTLYEKMKSYHFYNEYKHEIDLYYLHSFFVEPFFFQKGRGIVMDMGIFKYMCEEVKEKLPDYLDNPYLNDPSLEKELRIIELIGMYGKMDDINLQKNVIDRQSKLI